MKITRKELRQVIRESIQRLGEAEVIDLAQQRGLPWEFGPEGYSSRGHGLERKMGHIGRDPEGRDEEIIAVALSNRAEELIGYKRTIDPDYFGELAIVSSKSGGRRKHSTRAGTICELLRLGKADFLGIIHMQVLFSRTPRRRHDGLHY